MVPSLELGKNNAITLSLFLPHLAARCWGVLSQSLLSYQTKAWNLSSRTSSVNSQPLIRSPAAWVLNFLEPSSTKKKNPSYFILYVHISIVSRARSMLSLQSSQRLFGLSPFTTTLLSTSWISGWIFVFTLYYLHLQCLICNFPLLPSSFSGSRDRFVDYNGCLPSVLWHCEFLSLLKNFCSCVRVFFNMISSSFGRRWTLTWPKATLTLCALMPPWWSSYHVWMTVKLSLGCSTLPMNSWTAKR